MQDEIIRVDNVEKLQNEAPFLIYLPEGADTENMTYRPEGRKWATIRYECQIGGERLRVKEFFLDWFFPGFPKSLMDSFVSSYSAVDSRMMNDRVIFYGDNYKRKAASSTFSLGTQIEVEGETKKGVRRLSEVLAAPFTTERFRHFPFHRRSFFARGGKPEWFEEERISNLSWRPPSEEFCLGNLCLESVGILNDKDGSLETIFVFSEEFYRRAAWIDVARTESTVERLIYRLRGNGNFFDEYADGNPTLAFRRHLGPALSQFRDSEYITTISLSPLFQFEETRDLVGSLKRSVDSLERFI